MKSSPGVKGKAKSKRKPKHNKWYGYTYDAIVGWKKWDDLTAEIPLKVALVYSWMPTVVMHHKTRTFRSTLSEVQTALVACKTCLADVPRVPLMEIADLKVHQRCIEMSFIRLRKALGGVAASKFLHFSRPQLFPMYDTKIATINSGKQYYEFMKWIRHWLLKEKYMKEAEERYSSNILRGLDVFLMEKRGVRKYKFPPQPRKGLKASKAHSSPQTKQNPRNSSLSPARVRTAL